MKYEIQKKGMEGKNKKDSPYNTSKQKNVGIGILTSK